MTTSASFALLSTPPGTTSDLHSAASTNDWRPGMNLRTRHRVLMQILKRLKAKHDGVDLSLVYLARHAELALYAQAFSAHEYQDRATIAWRLHALMVKLHVTNLTGREGAAFSVEEAMARLRAKPPCMARKRRHHGVENGGTVTKRRRTHCVLAHKASIVQAEETMNLFEFDEQNDVLRHLTSFLAAPDALQLARTCTAASHTVPTSITTIEVSISHLERLHASTRSLFFQRFTNLERFKIYGAAQPYDGCVHVPHSTKLVQRNAVCCGMLMALARQPLYSLTCVSWHGAYIDGVHDHITERVAQVLLDADKFPALTELSLIGNATGDFGVAHLCAALQHPRRRERAMLKVLDLTHTFVGERGHAQMAALVAGSSLQVKWRHE